MLGGWSRVWSSYFYGGRRAPSRDGALMSYAISVFSGLAAVQALGRVKGRRRDVELGFLKQSLLCELARR